jgi:ATP-dependent Lhr-like helicase
MYEGDTPNAERRAAALSLDRDLLRELLGQDELRELIDPGALDQVEADLQHRSDRTRADSRDALADVLRRLGDLAEAEARDRVLAGLDAGAMLADLERERRAVRVRVGGEQRWIAADDAGLYRDAFGVVPPGGLPEAFLADVEAPLEKLVARYARTHGPFTTAELRDRYGVDPSSALVALERGGALVRGELRPGGMEREWCDPEVLRRLRRASLAVLRKEIEAADQRSLAAFLPSWQGVDRHPAGGAGVDRLREVLVPLQGLALPADVWERDVLPRRCGAYSPTWMDQLCASGEVVWVGAGALGRNSGRVALYFRDDAEAIGAPGRKSEPPAQPEHDLIRERLAQAPCFFTDFLAELPISPEQVQEALWDLVWAGEVTNDAWAPLRAPRLTLARAQRARDHRSRPGRRFGTRRTGAQAQVQGRWSLTSSIFRVEAEPGARRRTLAELLLERYGIVTREQVLAEGIPGGFAMLYDAFGQLETLGACRRGYFVEGLGGAQFALPGAVERLRAQRADEEAPPVVLAATDPAQPYGAALPWPRREEDGATSGTRRPQRVAGAYVVLAGAEPVVYVERGGKGIATLVDADDARLRPAFEALAAFVTAGRGRKLSVERVDGEPVVGSRWEAPLIELGFRAGPRKLTLSA